MYEVGIFGCVSEQLRTELLRTVEDMVADFGLTVGQEVVVHDADSIHNRNPRVPFAAIYFGGPRHVHEPILRQMVLDSIPIIPTISQAGDSVTDIPPLLRPYNVLRRRDDDPTMAALASALLECVGLLRPQRRVFISYRRAEARVAASQLHDLLTARGFDVFLDTHDLRPADPFQDILWHRLCDCDVMLMLDTPGYPDSKWTRWELGRTLAKNIHILRVIWPNHGPSMSTALSTTVYLETTDLKGTKGPLVDGRLNEIVVTIERLRARSIAARYKAIHTYLRLELEKIGASLESIGTNNAISVRLSDNRKLYAYPIVGIPTAELLHEIEGKTRPNGVMPIPALFYDHVGIRDTWINHLKWLDDHIRSVRAVKVAEAAWSLAVWES